MNMKKLAVVSVGACAIGFTSLAIAEHHEEHGGGGGGMERRDTHRVEGPKFAPHAPGVHPHPAGRGHAGRILQPRVVKWGNHGTWKHWGHPDFARPAYYWDWAGVHQVSCTAEDSYGDQYPVTESTFAGFGLANMTAVEDDALDRCYSESNGDSSCYLATCSHF
jgi:hypothetical protein